MLENVSLVWVEIGRGVPGHLKRNIQLHSEMYPNLRQILVTDAENLNGIPDVCEVFYPFNDPESKDRFQRLKKSEHLPLSQKDFWTNTTSRFFALDILLEKRNVGSVVHLESDCILLSLDAVMREFEFSNWGIAYPLHTNKIGCASIFLINSKSEFREFIEYIQAEWFKPNTTDMTLLGNFSTAKRVRILKSEVSDKWIFDPVTHGLYLFGRDARNSRWPFSTRGIVDKSLGALNPDKFSYEYSLVENRPSIRVLAPSGSSMLANLHMHSKRIPRNFSSLSGMLSREVALKRNFRWKLGRFDQKVFFERLLSWIFVKVLRKKKEIRFR